MGINYDAGNMYGSPNPSQNKPSDNTSAISSSTKDDEKKLEIQDLSNTAAQSLRDHGAVVMPKCARTDLTRQALWRINNALAKGTDALKSMELRCDGDIMDLYADSAAYSLSQNVLGLKNVRSPNSAQIRVAFPDSTTVSPFTAMRVDESATAFSPGVRVALSAQTFR